MAQRLEKVYSEHYEGAQQDLQDKVQWVVAERYGTIDVGVVVGSNCQERPT